MRLLIIGAMDGQIGAASQIAMGRGAKVSLAEDVDQGLDFLRAQGADLVMIDVRRDVQRLIECVEAERIAVPVIACGVASDASAAVRAIKAGAKEYLPLPPDAEMIAAVLAAVTEESHAILFKDPRMAQTMKLAEQVANSHASILITGESGTG
ncbi:MAG: sigma 54-interacting transcriptional regulator, partial [Bacteroidales bacterium]